MCSRNSARYGAAALLVGCLLFVGCRRGAPPAADPGSSGADKKQNQEQKQQQTAQSSPEPIELTAEQKEVIATIKKLAGEVTRNDRGAVTKIVLSATSTASDQTLDSLSVFSHLERLFLEGPTFTDAGMDEVAELTSLRLLNLQSTNVTGKGLAKLAPLENLVDIGLRRTNVNDQAMQHLLELPQLKVVNLTRTLVGDEGMKAIGKLPHLENINVTQSRVGNAGVKALQADQPIRAVNLSLNATIGNKALKSLARFSETLEYLNIDNCGYVTSAGFKHLAGMENLTYLSARRCFIYDEALKSIQDLPLEQLRLRGTGVSAKGMKAISDMTTLRVLDLSEVVTIGDPAMKPISRLVNLEELNLWATSITDKGLGHLAALENLKTLNLWQTKIHDDGLASIASLPELETLNLDSTLITGKAVDILAEGFPSLKHVIVAGTSLTEQDIARLKKARPELAVN